MGSPEIGNTSAWDGEPLSFEEAQDVFHHPDWDKFYPSAVKAAPYVIAAAERELLDKGEVPFDPYA